MSAIDSRVRTWLIWAMPFAVIALLIGWETDWGRALTLVPALDTNVVPKPVAVALLPEYKVDGGVEGNRETVERTLFNPTRRPAPPTAVAAGKSSMQKGQFVLTGTTVVDQKATAFLREVSGGRSRRVQQGETLNGMVVAEIRADRVKLTMNEDSEELTLKTAAGPRSTVQPVNVPVAGQPGIPAPPAGTAAAPVAGSNVAPSQDVADVLANRRRAARAAAAAGQPQSGAQPSAAAAPSAAAPATAAPAPAATTTAPARGPDPAWNEVYQRYMQPRK